MDFELDPSKKEGENLLFALDVGTRKVAGLLVAGSGDRARILASCVMEHPERAMLDGQVHHIDKAASVVARVKEALELQAGRLLKGAHVAVAGRSLLTSSARVSQTVDSRNPLSPQQVLALELQAVKEAKLALASPTAAAGCHCVGYTVTRALLDGVPLGSLAGHQGSEVELSVLATFLPRIVLDSLSAVLDRCGLALESLTLEPIAALEVAIPSDLRRLNLALVDVGAGTSDIALTQAGTVKAFAMVPLAGDEVTERLGETYLIDFEQAEKIKRELDGDSVLTALDLFGREKILDRAEAKACVEPVVSEMAREISAQILKLNGGDPPQAVLLVGGGSLSPGLDRMLAEALGIPASRVGHRPPNLQRAFASLPASLNHVWGITPLGIALSAMQGRGLPFAHFQVNGERVQALNLQAVFTVFDALIAAGREVRDFYGRPGLALTYTLNHTPKAAKGSLGIPARVYLRGVEVGFDHPLIEGDGLRFVEGQAGENGKITVGEALQEAGIGSRAFNLNGKPLVLRPAVLVNGQPAEAGDGLRDNAQVETGPPENLGNLLKRLGFDLVGLFTRTISIRVDGEPRVLTQRNYTLQVNGLEAPLDRVLAGGEDLVFERNAPTHLCVKDLLGEMKSRVVKVNGERVRLPPAFPRVTMNARPVSPEEFLIDGAEIKTSDPSLAEVLPFITGGMDKNIQVQVDGAAASASTKLRDGAEVIIVFEGSQG